MKVLVTGANGFLGGKLLPLLAEQHQIRGLVRTVSDSAQFDFAPGDVRAFESVRTALEGMDAVIHLAAMTAKPSAKDPLAAHDVNVKGTYNLAEAAVQAGVKRIVFASTIAVTGSLSKAFVPQYVPVDEDHPCLARDTYGITKYLGEEVLKAYSRQHDLATVCLRLNWVQDTRAAGASAGGQATFWSTVDYRDVMQALVLALESDSVGCEIINVASENNWFNKDSLELVRQHYPGITVDSDYFAQNPQRGIFSISKARKVLNYEPQYELQDANTGR